MTDAEIETIGSRIRSCRRFRGMSLETLAGLSGLSKGFLSMVENDKRSLNGRHHVAAIAEALRVSLTDLTGQPYPLTGKASAESYSGIIALRNVLMNRTLNYAEGTGSRPLRVLRDQAQQVGRLRDASNYGGAAGMLPALLDELHESIATGEHRQEATELFVTVVCQEACWVARDLGHPEISWMLADRAREAAKNVNDPMLLGFADFLRGHALFAVGGYQRARAVSTRAAEELQRHSPTGTALEVYGMLHLNAALASASAGAAVDALPHLAEATDVAAQTGEAHSFRLWFGPTNVNIWRMAYTAEAGDGGKVRELAAAVNPRAIPSHMRQAGYYVELGRGLAQNRKNDRETLTAFRRAKELNPVYVRAHPHVRNYVASMMRRSKLDAGGRELRGMAFRMGVTV